MKIFLYLALVVFIPLSSYANDKICIISKKNSSNYNDKTMYDLEYYITDCVSKKNKIDSYGFFGDGVKNNFFFYEKKGEFNRVYISTFVYNNIYEENPFYIYENGKYYFTKVYDCTKLSCKINNKITNFFGEGGSVLQVNNNKMIKIFPYIRKENIIQELNGNFYKSWSSNKIKGGIVLNKTYINDLPNYIYPNESYLIKGDNFKVKNISSRWLNIVYETRKGRKIEGWISCDDTNVCS